jgi:hypothetical protein
MKQSKVIVHFFAEQHRHWKKKAFERMCKCGRQDILDPSNRNKHESQRQKPASRSPLEH